jgi:prolyl-tRNA editing enzyme YbaK/EbsC (Cys-tRNA(Pro) deacylase)
MEDSMGGGELKGSALKVQKALEAFGMDLEVVELRESTRTSREAAQALGCGVGQIAKSLVFRGARSGKPILVIACGSNRVDEDKLAELAGEPVGKANADFVRETTGYSIGGVPPVGHSEALSIYIDRDLLGYGEIWAAAGTPHAVFKLNPAELARITGGTVAAVA